MFLFAHSMYSHPKHFNNPQEQDFKAFNLHMITQKSSRMTWRADGNYRNMQKRVWCGDGDVCHRIANNHSPMRYNIPAIDWKSWYTENVCQWYTIDVEQDFGSWICDWLDFFLSFFFFSLFRISRVIVRFSFSFLLSPTHTLRFLSKLKNNTHTMFHSLLKCVQCLSCRWFFPHRSVWWFRLFYISHKNRI